MITVPDDKGHPREVTVEELMTRCKLLLDLTQWLVNTTDVNRAAFKEITTEIGLATAIHSFYLMEDKSGVLVRRHLHDEKPKRKRPETYLQQIVVELQGIEGHAEIC